MAAPDRRRYTARPLSPTTPHPPRPEVLAPAGSPEALRAALHSGADAVYFGLQDGFNARARAANFTLAELPATVAQIHRAGARAYVTLNTLVFEPELAHVEAVLRGVAAAGVDALIVQDPAVCLLARAVCPELELHGSTQMTIASPRAAAFAAGLGITRVVVPRELSVREIEAFRRGTGLELEVFVHGALCVSWSGQCLTSEAWGGRSANRGQCAQSCRLPYGLLVDGERKDLGDVRYLLSPKDLAGARAVPELLQIGVHGLKIEGRQKGPQYVATATAGYRRWVDALRLGTDRKTAERQLGQDLLAMTLSYSRGFHDGFLAGSDHQTLVEGRFPKHRGVLLGRVLRVVGNTVHVRRESARPWTGGLGLARRPDAAEGTVSAPLSTAITAAPLQLQAGMGCGFDRGEPERDEPGGPIFRVDERDGEVLLGFGTPGPDLHKVRVGDRVWITNDPQLAVAADKAAADSAPPGRNPVQLTVRGSDGERLQVQAECRGHRAAAHSTTPLQPARGRGLDAALLHDKLGSFGGTPFALAGLDCSALAPGLHLPPAELKEVRRQLVSTLLPPLERGPVRTIAAAPVVARVRDGLGRAMRVAAPAAVELLPLVRLDHQLDAVLALGLPRVELDWMEFSGLGKAFARARAAGLQVTVATARIGKPGEEPLDQRLFDLQPDGILVRHWGGMMQLLQQRGAAAGPLLHGDFSLNVTNSLTARYLLDLGLDTLTASHDLDQPQLSQLLQHVPPSRLTVVAHHRIATFHTEHCLYSHLLSNGRDFHSCGRPCERHRLAVADPNGREHPVIVDVGCRNTVFHHAPHTKAEWAPQLLQQGVRRFRVEFVREDQDTVRAVLQGWQALLAGTATPKGVVAATGAETQFGVAKGSMQLLAE